MYYVLFSARYAGSSFLIKAKAVRVKSEGEKRLQPSTFNSSYLSYTSYPSYSPQKKVNAPVYFPTHPISSLHPYYSRPPLTPVQTPPSTVWRSISTKRRSRAQGAAGKSKLPLCVSCAFCG